MAKGAITVKIDGQYDNKDINRAIRDLNALKDKSKETAGPFSSLGNTVKSLGVAMAATFTVGAAVDFFKDSAAAAMEDQASLVKLATAMDNLGLSSQNAIAEDFISKLSMAVGVADDNLRPALQRLLTVTGDLTTSQDALSLALDISAGTGKDLDSVSTALAKAYGGQTTALGRLGVGLDSALLKSKDMGAITDALSAKFGGQAGAAAETYAGQMNRISVAAGEAKEKVGYSLLNAIDSLAGHVGGVDGITGAMDALGTKIANNIDLMAGFVDALASVGDAMPTELTDAFGGFFGVLTTTGPEALSRVSGMFKMLTGQVTGNAEAMREGRNQFYDIKPAADAAATGIANTAKVVSAASTEVTDLKDAFDALSGALNLSQSRDDFKKFLADLDEKLKGNARSFSGMSDAAKENRDTLRDAFSQAAEVAQKWADENGKSVTEMQGYYNGLARKIVTQFTKDGFKKSDIEKFLGSQGIWQDSGEAMGADMASGIAVGLRSPAALSAVRKAAALTARDAEDAARTESQTHSPSKKFQAIGEDLLAGLTLGLTEAQPKVITRMQSLMADVYSAAAKSKMDSSAMSDLKSVGSWIIEQIASGLNDAQGAIDAAKSKMDSFAVSVHDTLVGAFDISDIFGQSLDENGKVVVGKWTAGVDKAFSQFQWYTNVLNEIKRQGGSEALTQYLMQQGVAQGGAQGQAMLDNGLIPYFNGKLADVEKLAKDTGDAMAKQYYGPAVDSAMETYKGLKDALGKDGPVRKAIMGLMDGLAAAMARDVPIDIWITRHIQTIETVVKQAAPTVKGATGGIVNVPTVALIGEAGPEAVIPLNQSPGNGPLGNLGTGGGNSYTVNVSAGVGDPRAIGQTVIEYIKKFEKANGPVFAAA